jgi:PncC family amidohydrolase
MHWFRGGLVAYQSGVKRALLAVEPGPVVRDTVACQMAIGAVRLFEAEVAVSVTGVAGPDSLDGVEPGIVIVGVAAGDHVRAFTHRLQGEPAEICAQASHVALDDLAQWLARGET